MSCTYTNTTCQKTVSPVSPTTTAVPDGEHKPPKDDSKFGKQSHLEISTAFNIRLKFSCGQSLIFAESSLKNNFKCCPFSF